MTRPTPFHARWVLLAAVLAGCASHQVTPGIPSGDITLGVGEHRSLDASTSLGFERALDDSRCPTGVTCVWAGEAHARIWILAAGRDTAFGVLPVGVDSSKSGPIVTGDYRLRAIRLDPHPTADRLTPESEYRLTVRAERVAR